MQFDFKINGIPCIIEVTYYDYDPGNYHGLPENCYPSEETFEFKVLDRKGYPAAWLERKLTSNIEAEILEAYKASLDED